MAIVIRRSADAGDSRSPRMPFKEPSSAQPTIRSSALTFQGGNGDLAAGTSSPEGGWGFVPGTGVDPTYAIHSSGVPAYEFDATLAGASPERRPTIYNGASSQRPAVKSMLAVVRVLRLPTAPVGTGSSDRDLHFLRAGTSSDSTLSVAAPSVPDNGGKLFMRTPGGYVWGPDFPMDGGLHFVASVVDGAIGRLYLDEHVSTGAADAPTSAIFTCGFGLNGAKWQLVEAAHYDVPLSAGQVQAKRQHYRALYNF